MDVRTLVVDRNSEEDFRDKLLDLISASAGIIHVRTAEISRAVYALRRTLLAESFEYNEWDVINGVRQFTLRQIYQPNVTGDSSTFHDALQKTWQKFVEAKEKESRGETENAPGVAFVMTNPQFWLANNPQSLARLIEMATHLPSSSLRLILVTPDEPITPAVSNYVVTVDFDRPGHGELVQKALETFESTDEEIGSDFTEEEVARIAVAGAGMTDHEFEMALAKAIVEASKVDEGEEPAPITPEGLVESVRLAKTEVVRKNDLLEVMKPMSIDSVGGMEILKDWVAARSACYSQEAAEFGIEPPRGLMLIGVPGTGKSLLAKAVSSVLGIPLIKLDFSRMFNALVGSSEERMRTALKMIESMAPCVCFADEVDKGLGGISSGGGDSGTSTRVLGTFLTWLQECKAPVFTIATANNVSGLPPELLRRGRFDAIFSTTLPNEFEREDVLRIHLDQRGHSLDDFEEDDIAQFLQATDGYIPAEIEACVKDALIAAFNRDEGTLEVGDLLVAANSMVPLSKSHGDAIASMVAWSKDNATPASLSVEERARRDKRERRLDNAGKVISSGGNVRRIDTSSRRRVKTSAPRRKPRTEKDD